jgi:glycosyltransferase involved in cell wall biosynthesis
MIRIYLPCTGLGHQQRGFETFTREVAAALCDEAGIEITVFKGGGASTDRERTIRNLRRDGEEAQALSGLFSRSPYFIEQSSFFLGLLPQVARGKPDIIYYADINLGNALWHWRRISGQKFKLLFYNGGPAVPRFMRCDLIQQVAPIYMQEGADAGIEPQSQVLLPHGVGISAQVEPRLPCHRRHQLRMRFNLPAERAIVLSAGVVNASHKRMDYLIDELAQLNQPRPFLLILGQRSDESAAIERQARRVLGDENFAIRTIAREQMPDHYRAADVFALASLREGFGLVYVEALAHGLPVLAHDFPVTRYILGEDADSLADLSKTGALAGLIERFLRHPSSDEERRRRHDRVYSRFSWDALRPAYVEMFHKCMAVRGGAA